MPPFEPLPPESLLLPDPETIFEMEPRTELLPEPELLSELDPSPGTSRATSCTFCLTRYTT